MTTQPPDPQAIDEAVYEAGLDAWRQSLGMTHDGIRDAIRAALACDRRLRGEAVDAHGVDWHAQALRMERERDVEQSYRLEAQDMQRKAEADLAAARAEIERLKKEQVMAVNEMAKAREKLRDRESDLMTADWIMADPPPDMPPLAVKLHGEVKRLTKQLAAAQATIAGQGERVRELEASCDSCPSIMRFTRAGWVRDGDGGKDIKKPLSLSVQRCRVVVWDDYDTGGKTKVDIVSSEDGEFVRYADLLAWERAYHPTATAGSAGETPSPRDAAYGAAYEIVKENYSKHFTEGQVCAIATAVCAGVAAAVVAAKGG